MEYSLYINQLRAVEWELNASEAIVFAYLSNATKLQSHPEHPDFLWLQNSKIMLELPLIIRHKDSAKKHMIKLEKLGLVERFSQGHRSYFRITEKGDLWKYAAPPESGQSTRVKSGESTRLSQSRANRPDKVGSIGPTKSGQSAHITNIPISKKPESREPEREREDSQGSDDLSGYRKILEDSGFPDGFVNGQAVAAGLKKIRSLSLSLDLFDESVSKAIRENMNDGLPSWNFIDAVARGIFAGEVAAKKAQAKNEADRKQRQLKFAGEPAMETPEIPEEKRQEMIREMKALRKKVAHG